MCWRIFCCKRKSNWVDLESPYKIESEDMKRTEQLLNLDLDLVLVLDIDTDTEIHIVV